MLFIIDGPPSWISSSWPTILILTAVQCSPGLVWLSPEQASSRALDAAGQPANTKSNIPAFVKQICIWVMVMVRNNLLKYTTLQIPFPCQKTYVMSQISPPSRFTSNWRIKSFLRWILSLWILSGQECFFIVSSIGIWFNSYQLLFICLLFCSKWDVGVGLPQPRAQAPSSVLPLLIRTSPYPPTTHPSHGWINI